MAWLFDSSAWNLAGPVAVAAILSGCGPAIIVDQGGETDSIGDDGTTPIGDSCTSDQQCATGYCSAQGTCAPNPSPTPDPYYPPYDPPYDPCDYYGDCCYDGGYCCYDGYGYGDCDWDYDYCYGDGECDPGQACDGSYEYGYQDCEPVPAAGECNPEANPEIIPIPTTDITTSLAFAEADGTPGEELVSRNELNLRVHDDLDSVPTTVAQPVADSGLPGVMLAVDLDGDGLEEVIAAEVGDTPQLRLFAAQGGSSFEQAQLAPTDVVSNYQVGNFDGQPGPAVVGLTADGFAVTSTSGAALGATSFYPVSFLEQVAVGNFDGFDDDDLVLVHEQQLELQQQPGQSAYSFDWGWASGRLVAAANFDGDLRTDLATALPRGGESLIESWSGNTIDDGTSPSYLSVPFDVERMWPADIDGDGRDELILYGSDILALVRPSDDFATTCYHVLATGDIADVAVGDADGDGAQEVAYANSGGVFLVDFSGP